MSDYSNAQSRAQPTNSLIVAGVGISQDAEGRFSLNDFHKAAGGENRHRPSLWAENQQTKDLIAEIESGAGIPALVSRARGLSQGTYVCKELVYAYAMWISPSFHLAVIRAYDAMVTGQPVRAAQSVDQQLRAHQMRLRLIDRIKKETDPVIFAAVHEQLAAVSNLLGLSTPEIKPESKEAPITRQELESAINALLEQRYPLLED